MSTVLIGLTVIFSVIVAKLILKKYKSKSKKRELFQFLDALTPRKLILHMGLPGSFLFV